MRADKTDIHGTAAEEYHGYQTVVVALDIKNVPVIANKVNVVNALANVGQTFPVSCFALEIPLIQRVTNFGIGFGESPQRSVADDNHAGTKETRPLPAAFQK
jgi:hypothetical protein